MPEQRIDRRLLPRIEREIRVLDVGEIFSLLAA